MGVIRLLSDELACEINQRVFSQQTVNVWISLQKVRMIGAFVVLMLHTHFLMLSHCSVYLEIM